MRILQLANKMPYPPKDGGALGIHVFTESLIQAGQTVKVLAVNTPKLFTHPHEIPKEYISKTGFEYVEVDTRVKPLDAFISLVKGESYNIKRFDAPQLHRKIKEILQQQKFDIVQLESVYMAPYIATIRKYTDAKIVLRAHNIEYTIWERLAKSEISILKKYYLQLLATQLRKYETEMINQYDGITYITPEEGKIIEQMGCTKPTCFIPFGIPVSNYKPDSKHEEPYSVFSLGAMNWLPNLEGLKWFLNEIWPRIIKEIPEAKFYIAGRNMSSEWKEKKLPGVIMCGEVENASDFISNKSVMVVPLHSGGGMRVKIIEGFAMQKAIVATSVGAEGIACESGKNILIADKNDDFVRNVVLLLKNNTYRKNIAENARKLAIEQYDIQNLTKRLIDFYTSLISSVA
ncbi:MAG: glycosyltransferase family 4 protein [Chitinophagales bacterium]|nr:glycosyltransferase family 4 protein [Chitinophagales bacterium]